MPRHSPSATNAEKLIVLTDDTVPPVILIDDTLPPVDLDAGDIAQTLGADHTKPQSARRPPDACGPPAEGPACPAVISGKLP